MRKDPHTLAHLGAMSASGWARKCLIESVGNEIDSDAGRDPEAAMSRALRLRYLVEHHCADILRRMARAYGPYPLAMNGSIALRYQELDLYLRQSHAERNLRRSAYTFTAVPAKRLFDLFLSWRGRTQSSSYLTIRATWEIEPIPKCGWQRKLPPRSSLDSKRGSATTEEKIQDD